MNLQTSLTFLGKPERFDSFRYLLPSSDNFRFVYVFEHEDFPRVFICRSDLGSFLCLYCPNSPSKCFLYLQLRNQHIKMLRNRRPIKEIINSIHHFFLVNVQFDGVQIAHSQEKPSSYYGNYVIGFENII